MQTKENRIQVNMLGEFSIHIGNRFLTQDQGRTKRIWLLIEYLIANRKKEVSIDKMIEVFWPDDECKDPLNALKNLVYRARKLLKELSGEVDTEFILFAGNTYSWNNNLPCDVDTEQMEANWKEASNLSLSADERISSYSRALSLYKGEFLPKSSSENWVISANAHYSTIYNECVITVCDLLIKKERFEDVITICENAMNYSLFEEGIHESLLYAYMALHKYDKALAHYRYADNLFQNELGVQVSDSFAGIYKQIKNNLTSTELDLSAIKQDLNEACKASGAFFCDYDVFKELYRVQSRSILRTGQQVYIVLFTLSGCDGSLADEGGKKPALEILRSSILGSLRKGDVVSSYSPLQFIVMLPFITYENAQMVANRIQKAFRTSYQKNDVQILTKINPVDSGDT